MTKTSLLPAIKEEMCPAENIPTTAGLWRELGVAGTEPTELALFLREVFSQSARRPDHHQGDITDRILADWGPTHTCVLITTKEDNFYAGHKSTQTEHSVRFQKLSEDMSLSYG